MSLQHPPDRLPSLLPGYVPGRGRVGGIAIVGEAPGALEVVKRSGFVGAAGKTLRTVFSKFGVSQLEKIAWVTNAIPYRPPQNRTPTWEEIQYYRPRLMTELRQVKPRIVLLLGSVALCAVANDKKLKITKERGKTLTVEGLLCFATFHPSFVRRVPTSYRYLVEDVAEALRLAKGGSQRKVPEIHHRLISSDQIELAVNALLEHPGVHSCDLETTGLDLQTDRILDLGIRLQAESFCLDPLEQHVLIFSGDFTPGSKLIRQLTRLFSKQSGLQFLWHNGKFDTAFLQRLGLSATVDEDTMLLSYALDENTGVHDLKSLSSRLLGAPDYALSKKEMRDLANVPEPRRHTYLAQDVGYTSLLYNRLRRKVAQDVNLEKLYTETLIPVTNLLTSIEAHGILIDVTHLDILDATLSQERIKITEQLRGILNQPEFNPRSPQQVMAALYDGNPWNLTPPRGFGRTSQAAALERLESSVMPGPQNNTLREFLKGMRRVRKITRTKDALTNPLRVRLASDGRIHTTFKQHGTRTGRLSSEKPNMQNIPRDPNYRSLVCAPPGSILVELDWSQAELRLLADKSRDPVLLRVYQNNEDLHDEVVKSVVSKVRPDLPYREQRDHAKRINFRVVYGGGPSGMARDYDLDIKFCTKVLNQWYRRFAVATEWLEAQAAQALCGEPLISQFGRKRRFGLIKKDVEHHIGNEGKNFEIQADASDITCRCAVVLNAILPANVKIINMVHDSIILEMPADAERLRSTVLQCTQIMEDWASDYFKSPVPFLVDAKVGSHWGWGVELPRRDKLKAMPVREIQNLLQRKRS